MEFLVSSKALFYRFRPVIRGMLERIATRAEKLFIEKKGKLTEVEVPAYPDSGFAVMDMSVSAVKDGVPPETGGIEGLLAVAILEAVNFPLRSFFFSCIFKSQ